MKVGQGCIVMTCCPGDTICLASLRLRYPPVSLGASGASGLAGDRRGGAAYAESSGFRFVPTVLYVAPLVFLALWALGSVSVVLSAVLLWRFGIFGLWGGRFLGGTLRFGRTGFLPCAFRCLLPWPGFPWKHKGVLKCDSFRILGGQCVKVLRRPFLSVGSLRAQGGQSRWSMSEILAGAEGPVLPGLSAVGLSVAQVRLHR